MADGIESWPELGDSLIRNVQEAFKGVRVHRDLLVESNQREIASLGSTLESLEWISWENVNATWIEYNYDILSFVSPLEALLLLPAFVVYSINMMHSPTNVIQFLVLSLDCSSHTAVHSQRYGLLDSSQRLCVRRFLELVEVQYDSVFPLRVSPSTFKYWSE